MKTDPRCPKCRENAAPGTFTFAYEVGGGVWLWNVSLALAVAARFRRPPVAVQLEDLTGHIVQENLVEAHLGHVDPEAPCLACAWDFGTADGRRTVLLDGNHRVERRRRDGREAVNVLLLTPLEAAACLAQWPGYGEMLRGTAQELLRLTLPRAGAADVRDCLRDLACGLPDRLTGWLRNSEKIT